MRSKLAPQEEEQKLYRDVGLFFVPISYSPKYTKKGLKYPLFGSYMTVKSQKN